METKSESGSSSISMATINQIIERLRCERNRNTTRKNYHTIWRIFSSFYLKLDMKPKEWEDRLILFAGYLINEGKKATTVNSYISTIKSVLREDKIEVSEDQFLLKSLTRACKYRNERVTLKLPIQKDLLNRLLIQLDLNYVQSNSPQPYLAKLYNAIFATAYYGLLRISEIVKGEHPVLGKDVHIGINKNKMLFVLRTSKTHWKDNKPQSAKISAIQKTKNGGDDSA